VKHGDFTLLAKNYKHRTGYSDEVLDTLIDYTGATIENFTIADVGAGTGKLTEMFLQRGLTCVAVEPDDAMREEGVSQTQDYKVSWVKGNGEATTLEDNSVDWVTMASSFHWVDTPKGLAEFYRILKPGCYFTALWNPRDLQRSEFHMNIEKRIKEIVPDLKRVSSGTSDFTSTLDTALVSTRQFKNVEYLEAEHEVVMTPDRYMGAWQSVNDIRVQAGEERWQKILDMIGKEIDGMSEIIVPYKTRSWAVQRID